MRRPAGGGIPGAPGRSITGGPESCARVHARTEAPFEAARTWLSWGQRLRRDGRRIEARERLRAALAGFRALGAPPWIDGTERELSATGERLRRREPGAAEAMTAQEHQIARLVVGGTSNKGIAAQLFLSPKTVEAHLTRIYRKLGVHSRTQLAAQLDRPGAVSGDHAGSPST